MNISSSNFAWMFLRPVSTQQKKNDPIPLPGVSKMDESRSYLGTVVVLNRKHYPNKMIYNKSKIIPIENELINYSLKFIDKEKTNHGSNLKYCVRYDEDYMNSISYYHSKPLIYIDYLKDCALQADEENFSYYDLISTLENHIEVD